MIKTNHNQGGAKPRQKGNKMFYNIYQEERQQKRRRIFWLVVFWLLAIICGVGGFVSVTELYYATHMAIQSIWTIALAISIIGFAGCVYFILMIK